MDFASVEEKRLPSYFTYRTHRINQASEAEPVDPLAKSKELRTLSQILQEDARRLREEARFARDPSRT